MRSRYALSGCRRGWGSLTEYRTHDLMSQVSHNQRTNHIDHQIGLTFLDRMRAFGGDDVCAVGRARGQLLLHAHPIALEYDGWRPAA